MSKPSRLHPNLFLWFFYLPQYFEIENDLWYCENNENLVANFNSQNMTQWEIWSNLHFEQIIRFVDIPVSAHEHLMKIIT